MFQFLGTIVAIYTAYAVIRGEVFAKAGAWGKTIYRDESEREFWVTIVIYGILAAALIFYF